MQYHQQRLCTQYSIRFTSVGVYMFVPFMIKVTREISCISTPNITLFIKIHMRACYLWWILVRNNMCCMRNKHLSRAELFMEWVRNLMTLHNTDKTIKLLSRMPLLCSLCQRFMCYAVLCHSGTVPLFLFYISVDTIFTDQHQWMQRPCYAVSSFGILMFYRLRWFVHGMRCTFMCHIRHTNLIVVFCDRCPSCKDGYYGTYRRQDTGVKWQYHFHNWRNLARTD